MYTRGPGQLQAAYGIQEGSSTGINDTFSGNHPPGRKNIYIYVNISVYITL